MFEFTLFFSFRDCFLGLFSGSATGLLGYWLLALALPLHDRRSDGPMRHERACVDGCRHFSGPSTKKLKKARIPTLLYKNARLTDQAADTGSRIDTGWSLLLESSQFLSFSFLFFIFLDCHYHHYYSLLHEAIDSLDSRIMSQPEENQMMPQREEKEETQKEKEEKHRSLDHEAQKHPNKNVTVILDLEESTSTTSSSKTSSSSPSNGESSFPFTPQDQKRIIRQIDLRVVLLLGAMYAVSLIDRSQIGLAMISGMGADLQLTVGARYNIINAVFFGPYVLFQLPSTVLLRKIGPKRFLSGATLAWGLATLACGFVREWRDLVALRVVLGACEAGFYPGGFLFLLFFLLFLFFCCIGCTSIFREKEKAREGKRKKKRKKLYASCFFCFTLLTHITSHFLSLLSPPIIY